MNKRKGDIGYNVVSYFHDSFILLRDKEVYKDAKHQGNNLFILPRFVHNHNHFSEKQYFVEVSCTLLLNE